MAHKIAVATLLYSADYLPGVFTVGYQLQKLRGDRDIALLLLVSRELYQEILSELSMGILRELYSEIVVVDPVEGISENQENLILLRRPELYFTLVKARLWELDYDKVLYLDGDTLPLSPDLFNLFEEVEVKPSEVAGAPDVGWPDMFNSGVLLLAPDAEIARRLRRFIRDTVSLDGADQGILNQFFNANCHRGAEKVEQKWIRLPFVHNFTMPNYGYESSPATKYFEPQIKLVHFIGENKPWKGWRGEKNDYSSHWKQVFTEFQAEYGLSPYMQKLNLQSSQSPWKESLEENVQKPERVFPDIDGEQLEGESQRVFPAFDEEYQMKREEVVQQEPERVFPTLDEEYHMKGKKLVDREPERRFPELKEEEGKKIVDQEPERVFPQLKEEKGKIVEKRSQRVFSVLKEEKGKKVVVQRAERVFPLLKEEEGKEGHQVQRKVMKQTKTLRRKTFQAPEAGKKRGIRPSTVERVFPEDT